MMLSWGSNGIDEISSIYAASVSWKNGKNTSPINKQKD